MVSRFFAASVSAVLCAMSIAPGAAVAQERRFAGFDAPRGASATLNLRVPFGPESRSRASYGLTVGYGRTMALGPDGRVATRAMNFADIRFTGDGLSQARLASFDLANLDRDRRLNMVGGKKSTLIIGVIIGAALVICLAADCIDGDDSEPAD